MNPVLLVVAGPNGAGKTTVTARLRAERWSEGVEYLNPDEIARDRFGDWNSPDAILKAAEWTKQRREDLLARGAGIAFETVFSTDEKIDFVSRAKDAGYFVRVFFIATSDPRINAARVAGRVLAGGHDVPIEKILSRHVRVSALERKTGCCASSMAPDRSGSRTQSLRWRDIPTSSTSVRRAAGRGTGAAPPAAPPPPPAPPVSNCRVTRWGRRILNDLADALVRPSKDGLTSEPESGPRLGL